MELGTPVSETSRTDCLNSFSTDPPRHVSLELLEVGLDGKREWNHSLLGCAERPGLTAAACLYVLPLALPSFRTRLNLFLSF
jgi:hypothetical protein